jgi:hypothetical protein
VVTSLLVQQQQQLLSLQMLRVSERSNCSRSGWRFKNRQR